MSRPKQSGKQPPARRQRASQRAAISIDLAATALHALMTEQCRHEGGYLTVYRGSRAALVAAGIPDIAFPAGGEPTEFQFRTDGACCTGRAETLKGSVRQIDGAYELEVDWGGVRPYVQGAHPAVSELARLISVDLHRWTSPYADATAPMARLASHPQSCYRAAAQSLQVSEAFLEGFETRAHELYQYVHSYCEVFQRPEVPAPELKAPGLRLVKS